ncbi:hypothetical protein BDW22DRAFT_1190708 [Trametopsis cervina]|nr:hypothetical protein BDW22DRAFT_1190708 [Trametopsis cervina]
MSWKCEGLLVNLSLQVRTAFSPLAVWDVRCVICRPDTSYDTYFLPSLAACNRDQVDNRTNEQMQLRVPRRQPVLDMHLA